MITLQKLMYCTDVMTAHSLFYDQLDMKKKRCRMSGWNSRKSGGPPPIRPLVLKRKFRRPYVSAQSSRDASYRALLARAFGAQFQTYFCPPLITPSYHWAKPLKD
ncbi:hypothetical protein NQ318_021360 [Aromia moschata]|uniref:Uncharacterized protein n=1 Tax=Aromia moschata TaxID=1265417 RepID=A0AAV8ZEI3_9CUCU|nr:hypothetical protein NQ318_021360 [Aromia moschata]